MFNVTPEWILCEPGLRSIRTAYSVFGIGEGGAGNKLLRSKLNTDIVKLKKG